jgi:hypothetical protein
VAESEEFRLGLLSGNWGELMFARIQQAGVRTG